MSTTDRQNADLAGKIAGHYAEILRLIGENPEREGLRKTPMRAAKALLDITSGYRQDAKEILQKAIFTHSGSQMVVVKGIEFYSMCEHHILPFFGTVAVGYIPDGKIVGLSKLARVVNVFARRLQVQEQMTAQICNAVATAIPNKGVIVACSGEHMCMKMRGVEKQNSATVTYDYTGCFSEDPSLRAEFRELISTTHA